MKHEYPYDLVTGHIILKDGNAHYLIDTGASQSFGSRQPIVLAGKTYDMQQSFMGAALEPISTFVGITIDCLIGTDILNQYDILIDPKNSRITLSDEDLPLPENTIPLSSLMGVPILEANISGKNVELIFDTGAKLSYLAPELNEPFPPAGEERDFHPSAGDFISQTYTVSMLLGDQEITLRTGILPDEFQAALMMVNAKGVLGSAILDTHAVLYAPRQGAMVIQS